MTTWADRKRVEALERDDTRFREHQVALPVPCPDPPHGCSAHAGDECRNIRTGRPLEHQVAHRRRIEEGERRIAAQQVLPEQRGGFRGEH